MTKNIRSRNGPAQYTCNRSQQELGHSHGCNWTCAGNFCCIAQLLQRLTKLSMSASIPGHQT
ncbi:hypothetical protein DPMN_133533 [Dreissena polymorpha]|uniref:Uncharacterized protein n=1 Tax=Dreissena polymorpha TaxID=45954 RepID=A0A9D4J9V6_DREPO|nr:hypothetical protein DPMN_133533 [Dreissena polymorpha]